MKQRLSPAGRLSLPLLFHPEWTMRSRPPGAKLYGTTP